MDWKKWLGRIDRWVQSAWFWGGLIFAAAGGSLLMLGRATELFQAWAPFSYGLAFWIAVPIVLWCLVPLKRLIPRRAPKAVRLGREALSHARSIVTSLQAEQIMGLNPHTYYSAVAFMVRLEKAGFRVPVLPKGDTARPALEMLGHYLSIVGALLAQGDAAEARQVAQQIADEPA